MNSKKPWDYHPHLSQKRLTIIAHVILQARNSCLELHDEDGGDTRWSLHCRSFDRCRTHLTRLIQTSKYEWLSLVDGGMKYQFKIGVVLFRFFRGDPDKPNERTLAQDLGAMNQWSFNFDIDEPASELKWRFAVETNVDGEVTRIVVIGCRSVDEVRCSWDVPLMSPVRVISPVDSLKESGVNIPAPRVGVPGKKQQITSGNNDNDTDNG